MTTPDHAAIRARLAAATDGPWTSADSAHDPDVTVETREGYLGHCPDCGVRAGFDEPDAVLIAHAPTDLAALLAERDDLAAENQRLRDTFQAVEALLAKGDRLGADVVAQEHVRAALGVSGE